MRWATPGIDPVLEDIKRCEEEERRAKRRKLGVDDGISSVHYKAGGNLWGIKILRKLEYNLGGADASHVHLTARFYDRGKPDMKIKRDKKFEWFSMPVQKVWNAFEKVCDTGTHDKWKVVASDKMLILVPADDRFSPESSQAAKKKVKAILERSQDEEMPGHVSVPRYDGSYMFWKHAFPEVVRLWPVPGVVEL
jgi:hypothetical protein